MYLCEIDEQLWSEQLWCTGKRFVGPHVVYKVEAMQWLQTSVHAHVQ
jgi:hypothetical protein